jgi:indole-3-acetate O-methyltransferase
MLHLLKEALDGVELHDPNIPFVVVDLGSSCGINTINVMDVIIKDITKRYEALGFNPPEFSAFFSDLPSNDFNSLFQLLPPIANYGVSMEECLAANNHRSYFAAGVPGSFYRRLFPARSVDLFHSAFSLHWLSQVIYQFLLIYQHHSFFFLYLLLMYFYLKFYFIRKKVHE